MEATEEKKETFFEFGDLADCYRGDHAELVEIDDDSFCPRCGIVVEKKEKKTGRNLRTQ